VDHSVISIMRFLILEDHPAIQLVLEQTITKLFPKSELEIHNNTEDALNSLNTNEFNYVVTDIQIRDKKDLDLAQKCQENQIPFLVYTSHLNRTIIEMCINLGCNSYVCKSSEVEELKAGLKALVKGSKFNCSITKQYIEDAKSRNDFIPEVQFTDAEYPIIMAQINGESTIELSKRLNKSKSTIRNQRIHLMLKNDCSMEEIARRYLYWNTPG